MGPRICRETKKNLQLTFWMDPGLRRDDNPFLLNKQNNQTKIFNSHHKNLNSVNGSKFHQQP